MCIRDRCTAARASARCGTARPSPPAAAALPAAPAAPAARRRSARPTAVSYTHLDAADERSSVDLGGRRIIKKKTNEEARRGASD